MYCIQIEVEHDGNSRDVVAGVIGLDVTFGDNCSCGFEFENFATAHVAYDKLIEHQLTHEIEVDFIVTWLGDELPFKEDNTVDSYVFIDGAWYVDVKQRIHISLEDMKTVTSLE